MVDFTVAICTYNGEQRLPEVLDKLRSQEKTEKFSWEILVIDNNSKDKTAEVVREYRSRWDRPYPVIYCFEPEQGLAFARRHAIREAKSDLIGFLDDDNLPDPNWVAEAYRFGIEHPDAGAYGGQIRGDFEVDPPEGFDRIARYFAILEGNKTYCYNERYKNTRKKNVSPRSGNRDSEKSVAEECSRAAKDRGSFRKFSGDEMRGCGNALLSSIRWLGIVV